MPDLTLSRDEAVGRRLRRLWFDAPDDLEYVATSFGHEWDGAFLTHIRTGPSGSVDGCWSWLSVGAALSPGADRLLRQCQPGGPLERPAGALRIGLPGEPLRAQWTGVIESLNLFLDPGLFERVLQIPFRGTRVMDRPGAGDTVIEYLLRALLAANQADSQVDTLGTEMIIAAVLQRLGDAAPNPPKRSRPLSSRHLASLTDYVAARIDGPLHLTGLADHLQISVRTLCRSLKAATGLSPHQFVLKRRIEHACHLLANTSMPIDSIAEKAGFADRNHMTATFRRTLKATPLQIRHMNF